MKHKFFTIMANDTVASESELNAFCDQHRVTGIDKQFVTDGANSFWSICVTWVEKQAILEGKHKSRIDYKEILNDDDFSMYSQLRELRKQLADREGMPAYHIFTNEQLANIVRQRITTKTDMLNLEGVGETRVEKYGHEFIQRMKAMTHINNRNETNLFNA